MRRHRNERGFTLIEVLVALAIIAVAMAAAVRVAGLMTQSNGLLRDKSMAMLAAQSRLAELQLEGRLTPGKKTFECDQGRLKLRCEQTLSSGTIAGWCRSMCRCGTSAARRRPWRAWRRRWPGRRSRPSEPWQGGCLRQCVELHAHLFAAAFDLYAVARDGRQAHAWAEALAEQKAARRAIVEAEDRHRAPRSGQYSRDLDLQRRRRRGKPLQRRVIAARRRIGCGRRRVGFGSAEQQWRPYRHAGQRRKQGQYLHAVGGRKTKGKCHGEDLLFVRGTSLQANSHVFIS